ncbi:hypothetical protein L596_015955 [Steinernema carpocapsae]|uniref:Uncharacterized protein n=1 Tax=Steinernema carpocapsae TaxID=34508 RepID=A0A4U5NH54_STECR|nr:hypothetical protein L596_015955 [Steinernema carpocapsae]
MTHTEENGSQKDDSLKINMTGVLMERTLLASDKMVGKEVKLNLYDSSFAASGTLAAMESDFGHYIVKDLKLSNHTLPSAMLRGTDTLAMSVDFDKLDQKPFVKKP